MKIRLKSIVLLLPLFLGCMPMYPSDVPLGNRFVPAEEFSKTARTGNISEYSMLRAAEHAQTSEYSRASLVPASQVEVKPLAADTKLTANGYELRRSAAAPITIPVAAGEGGAEVPYAGINTEVAGDAPVGSQSPYLSGQQTNNPSLWPDEGAGASLFRDFRAFQTMDVITISINEKSEGKKKAATDSESKTTLSAAIKSFFGIETRSWSSNNANLDPASLINAESDNKFEGDGETNRSGSLKAQISAVIMEVLPNGLLRVEGSKIVSVNSEEEIMVVSGLVRQRDVDANNQVDSSRIANMRVDFYGRGTVGENQTPGWGARLVRMIWPF